MNQSGAKVGVVLSGGGAFGAFEVGVLKALCGGKCPTTANHPLEVDVFTGTSVGSFNATVMSMKSGLGPVSAVQHLEDLWLREICDCPGDDRGNSVFRLRGNPVHYIDFPLTAAGRVLVETMRDARDFSLELFRRLGSTISASGSLSRRALGLIIYLDPDVSAIPLPRIANTIDTFSRAYSIMLAISINEDIKPPPGSMTDWKPWKKPGRSSR